MATKLKYRKPGLVNLFEMDTHFAPEVWVTAAFVKPGTHQYIISDYRSERKEEHHENMHECKVQPRVENIVPFERITKLRLGDVFHRYKTIFAPWPNEGEPLYRQCMEHDIKLWKVTRLIKDADDYKATTVVLLKHAKVIQNLFAYLCGKSQFPTIGLLDLGVFCQDSKIIDNKVVSSTIDRQFIAATSPSTNTDLEKNLAELKKLATKAEWIKLQPDGALVRPQFVEILVRIAGQKYKGHTFTPYKMPSESITTYARATEILITENILGNYDFETPD